MIPNWIRAIFGSPAAPIDDGLECKLRGLQNMKRLNDLVISGELSPAQLTELEVGAETLSMNLKKRDTDSLKKRGAV